MKKIFTGAALLLLCFGSGEAVAQGGMLNKLKQKANNIAEKALDKTIEDKTGIGNGSSNNSSATAGNSSSSRARNKGGEGLISTPPDVNAFLGDADKAFKAGTYGEARYAVQQAMLGVELQIGQKILKSLPESISGLNKDESVEQVASSGWGWAGLTIMRQYTDNNEKELRVMVANNSVMLSAVNMYLANGGYTQTSGEQQNWKQTKVKGHRAVIEYDDASGYKLTVPMGQSSLLVYEGVNFKNEQDMMAAANAVDIDGIKKMLGEK
ncbi:hypothetical protein I0P70_05940 [Pontibacter sp. FD36]|uniref:hypothetical protein n=1 Tax=Pontibacter sp. FD36 TaxID=2789860 RepID=UPI0018AC0C31|nr:hypothetical protein [Pontibacter sp. FD36]MBF8962779.1 hypothetical protein [Pontibacter sp. FD36]